MDKCFYNGNFINTSNYSENIEMLCINNGLIQYKGIYNEKLFDNSKERVNLLGKTLIPGFNDSHMHLLGLGVSLDQVDLSHVRSIDELILESKKYLKNNSRSILEGRGWNQDKFYNLKMPTKHDLNKISIEIPIILRRACGHILVANSKALDLITIDLGTINGRYINFDTGILKENGQDLLLNKLPVPTKNEMILKLKKAAIYARAKGITSVQSDDLCVYPKKYTDIIFSALNAIKDDFPLRVYEQSLFRDLDNFKKYLKGGYEMTNNDSFLNFGPLKILLDGALGSSTAYMLENYENSNNRGILMYKANELYNLVSVADENKIDVAIHAIGDGAIDLAVKSIANTNNHKMRHSIIHCQITNSNLIKRISRENILTHIQPIFLDNDIHIVEKRIGIKKTKSTYAYNSMYKSGIKIAFGSDSPVDKINPLLGIHLAVNRTDLNGLPKNGFLPNEKIDIKKALRFYTLNGAFAEHKEHKKGSLDIGKYADFTILDKNILKVKNEDIKSIKIIETYVNGKTLAE